MAEDEALETTEYEREPVPQRALLGFKSFVGMYAGEHTAGTELMIGPLFVIHGVSAYDLIVGLLLGNLLAVLSWMFLTAPIATRARLTLYYQLEKICGRGLVTLYNLANGVMFCFLAGAMVTVSATAVGVIITQGSAALGKPTDFQMPGLSDIAPFPVPDQVFGWFDTVVPATQPVYTGWIIVSLLVGLMIAIVAAYGYKFVAKVANVAAPWMTLIFLAFGLIALRQFMDATDTQVRSASDLWQLANTYIWKGGEPQPGYVKFTLWHVMFFAWFCNMAMHVGMSDLSVLRYAKKSWYAVASAGGMYLGHFMAWIAASLLYALQLHHNPADTTPLPGRMAYEACGIAGLVCVIVAGWTTANPTIYRAGLAFQAIMPSVSRVKVTLATGMLAAVAGMFPAIAMKLLGFVAIYGLILMPMGAVVFVDFWLMPKLGLRSGYAELSRTRFNWAAGAAWLVTLAVCVTAVLKFGDVTISGVRPFQIYFVSLPGWFLAAVLYIVLSYFVQSKSIPGGASAAVK